MTPAVAAGDANFAVSSAPRIYRATSPSRRHDNYGTEGTKVVLVLLRRSALELQVVIEGIRTTKQGLVS